MGFFWALLGVLACYRVARMVAWETGAFRVFERLRNLFPNNPTYQEGITCVYCISFWLAIPAALLVFFPSPLGDFTLLWLGIAGAVSLWFDAQSKS